MSIEKKSDGVFKVRWWEGGRQKSVIVHGSYELAKKVERKKLRQHRQMRLNEFLPGRGLAPFRRRRDGMPLWPNPIHAFDFAQTLPDDPRV